MFTYIIRGGLLRRNNLENWDFYSAVVEDFLTLFYDYDTNAYYEDIPTIGTRHKALTVTRSFSKRCPEYEMCYMEEFILSKLVSNTKRHGIKCALRKTHLDLFQNEN